MSSSPNETAPAVTVRAVTPVSMKRYDVDFQGFSDALGASFVEYGFAVVADHALDDARIAAALADAKSFFALPEAVKRQYHQPGTGGARGLTRSAWKRPKGPHPSI